MRVTSLAPGLIPVRAGKGGKRASHAEFPAFAGLAPFDVFLGSVRPSSRPRVRK